MIRIVPAAFAFVLLSAAAGLAQQSPSPSREAQLQRDGIIWTSHDAWGAPFAENLSPDLKVAGLSRFWMEVKLNFPNFARIAEVDWDKAYVDLIPKVRATSSTYEYYRLLQQMCALLKDGHSSVFLPKELADRMEADVPLQTELIQGRVFVTRVGSRALEAAGITPGLEILTIDGAPVHEYAAAHRAPFVSSNSPQHRDLMVYSYGLLAGPRHRPTVLGLRRKDGTVVSKTVARTPYADTVALPPVVYRQLDGNIAYLAINTFNSEDVPTEFAKYLPAIRASDGLIIDVRQNDGGSGVIAYNIISYLTDKPFKTTASRTRQYTATLRTWGKAGAWYEIAAPDWGAKPDSFYAKPVVMLIGPRSLSATDVFAETFQRLHRGKLIGEPTGGSIGDPLPFALPGGGSARVATSTDLGGGLVGRGVIPDVPVTRTIDDLLSSRDAALAKGLEELRAAPPQYDAALAKRLGASDRGMKAYVFVMLKTGPKADLSKEELSKLFAGHLANIKRLSHEGKLLLAGPFADNKQSYEGIFILNVATLQEAETLMQTDPAVASGRFVLEMVEWYGSAAIQELPSIHARIETPR